MCSPPTATSASNRRCWSSRTACWPAPASAVADQTFRLMDPDSQRMMGLRADTTPQVARIATTRLGNAPRPLRLSYAGQCLRVRGNQLAPDRQVAQAGIELIGHDSPEADAETILVAAEALAAVGLTRVSFDLTLPMLVPSLLDEAGITGADRVALARALDRKDAAAVAAHGGALAPVLTELLLAAGPADRALAALARGAPAGPRGRRSRSAWPRPWRRSAPRDPNAAPDDRSGRVPRLSLREPACPSPSTRPAGTRSSAVAAAISAATANRRPA